MIVHQHVCMNPESKTFSCLGQQLEVMEPVGVVTVHRFALITTGGDMVTAPRPFNAQWSGHGGLLKLVLFKNQARFVNY
jgi:hypothetical protein